MTDWKDWIHWLVVIGAGIAVYTTIQSTLAVHTSRLDGIERTVDKIDQKFERMLGH